MKFRVLSEQDEKPWQDSLLGFPDATYTHDWRWGKLCWEVYGWRPIRVFWEGKSEVLGMLQLSAYPFPFSSRALSMPFATVSGVLALDHEIRNRILDELPNLIHSLGLGSISLREISTSSRDDGDFTFILSMSEPSKLWDELDAKVRNQVRKAKKEGFYTTISNAAIDSFYSVYDRKMSELGTPGHRRDFFSRWAALFNGEMTVLTIHSGNQELAGAMVFMNWKQNGFIPLAATYSRFNSSCANMLLYWEALAHASQAGIRSVDFGRSHHGSGTYKFKCQWGASPVPIQNVCVDRRGGIKFTSGNLYRSSAAEHFSGLWRKMPYALTQFLGPCFRKWIP